MTASQEKFKILVSGKKERLQSYLKKMPHDDDIHILYTSSAAFVLGRAMFNPPQLALVQLEKNQPVPVETFRQFTREHSDTDLLIIAEGLEHQDVVACMNAGAKGCFFLPGDSKLFYDRLQEGIEAWRSTVQKREFTQRQQEIYDFSQIVGRSNVLNTVLDRARTIIDTPGLNVLITGETGTGKELLARAIHYSSSTKTAPFVDIGCSALPESLLESELFGYEKGAFTDAKERKIGLFELAGSGTIFLDEIGDITRATQSKLLKVIETHTMRRLGGLKDIKVNARMIAATSIDLNAKVQSGEFRRDLFHRLSILPLELPPLRRRKDDIPFLVERFLAQFNGMYKRSIKGIEKAAMDAFAQYDWPGNIRELQHCIERSVLLEDRDRITVKHLELGDDTGTRQGSVNTIKDRYGSTIVVSVPLFDATMDNVEEKLVSEIMRVVEGNKTKAAQILNISRPRLDRILSKTNGSNGRI